MLWGKLLDWMADGVPVLRFVHLIHLGFHQDWAPDGPDCGDCLAGGLVRWRRILWGHSLGFELRSSSKKPSDAKGRIAWPSFRWNNPFDSTKSAAMTDVRCWTRESQHWVRVRDDIGLLGASRHSPRPGSPGLCESPSPWQLGRQQVRVHSSKRERQPGKGTKTGKEAWYSHSFRQRSAKCGFYFDFRWLFISRFEWLSTLLFSEPNSVRCAPVSSTSRPRCGALDLGASAASAPAPRHAAAAAAELHERRSFRSFRSVGMEADATDIARGTGADQTNTSLFPPRREATPNRIKPRHTMKGLTKRNQLILIH